MPSFAWAADRDPLDEQTWRALVAGVSTRSYAASLDPVPDGLEERSTSRSAVSRRFVALSQRQLTTCLSRPLGDLDLRVVMIDGIDYQDHAMLIALGIDTRGTKHVLGVREGTTEHSTVAGALLSDLVDRGLDAERPVLFVIDGAKALRKAIRRVFGTCGVVQRCQVHKLRNVLEHLPEDRRPSVRHAMRQAYDASTTATSAQRQLERLARSLDADHPGAAASLREGLEETLTVQALGIPGALWKTLRSTNPIENLNGGGREVHAQRASLAQWVHDSPVGRVSDPRRRAAVPSRARLSRDASLDPRASSAHRHQRYKGGKTRRLIRLSEGAVSSRGDQQREGHPPRISPHPHRPERVRGTEGTNSGALVHRPVSPKVTFEFLFPLDGGVQIRVLEGLVGMWNDPRTTRAIATVVDPVEREPLRSR